MINGFMQMITKILYLKNEFDFSNFEKVDLPHTNIELPYNYFDEKSYQFIST